MVKVKILAIDIGGTTIKSCLSDEKGNISEYRETATEAYKGGKHICNKLITIIESYDGFDRIGISTAGQVDSEKGHIIYANKNIPGYTGTRLREILEDRFNKSVKVENDVNAAALGEKYFGAAKDYKDFLCLTYGTGIGGAIYIDSNIYKGADGVAAEFGHIITRPIRDENAGKVKYYEDYASTTALVKKAKSISSHYANGRRIVEELKKGNQ